MEIIGKITKINAIRDSWASCVITTDSDENITCVGNMHGLVLGMRIKAEGEYKQHAVYGNQFAVSSCELDVDFTKEYALRYLMSGAVKGVGPETAKKIVDTFGDDTMAVFEGSDYSVLAKVDGIGMRKAKKIHDSYTENNVYRKLLGYANLSISKADKLYKAYGDNALSMIKNKPYQIIYDIDGFGFKTVDDIALKNGWNETHPDRIGAAITYLLLQYAEEGHCYCTVNAIEENVGELLPNVEKHYFAESIAREIQAGNIVLEDGNIVYAKKLHSAESNVAKNLAEMIVNKDKLNLISLWKIEKAIADMESETGFVLEEHQKEAITSALTHRVSVITGGPGTGKSTIIKAIVNGWMTKYPGGNPEEHIIQCAPTGKAARRMAERSGMSAETVQRILVKQRSEDAEPIENRLIIVDESSMLDIVLANAIIKIAINGNNNLVFIGDADQLPPIGPGNFLRDLVNSPCVPTITLKLCHRQSGTIALNAKRVNEGRGYATLDFKDPSCRFVYAEKQDARQKVLEQYHNLLSRYDVRDICVVVPMRKAGKSQTSADDLNRLIREEINPAMDSDVTLDGCNLRIGDRVMYTSNDYTKAIFNGDCGIISDFDTEFGSVFLDLDDGRVIELSKAEASNLIFAYAITVHKSQGSEFKAVVIAHNREHAFMLQRNLLYTAMTRAKEKVILVGEPAALNMAIQKVAALERQTKLQKRIALEVVAQKSM